MRKFLRFLLFLLVVGSIGYGVWASGILKSGVNFNDLANNFAAQKKNLERPFPESSGPKKVTYHWTYDNKSYDITLTLFKSIFDYYQASPKEYTYFGDIPQNWENEYYGMFLKKIDGDNTIPELAQVIKQAGKKNNLSDDQIVDLTLSFVQSIPYDESKAKIIESGDSKETPRYPYEVLYENKGVCSDKSFLADALIRELGYGTVLFEYQAEKHMAIGIQCPQSYSTYNSGYCYAETTQPGHKIGVLPDLEGSTNIAIAKKEMGDFNQQENNSGTRKLGEAKMFQNENGKSYSGVIETIKTGAKIDSMEGDLASSKKQLIIEKADLDKQSQSIDDLGKKLKSLKSSNKIDEYNSLVPKYNGMVADYKKAADTYNKKINDYNSKVKEYNSLIKEFSSF